MVIATPAPFSLTPDEANLVQGEQSRRQTVFAQQGATFKVLSIAVPVLSIGAIVAIDRLLVGGTLSVGVYIGLAVAYLMGLFVQLAVMANTLAETKRRMLVATPQVWEERTITLVADGLVQDTPTSHSTFYWSAFRSVDRDEAFIWLWLTEFNAVVVPVRAFASMNDADAFEVEVRRQTTPAT